MALNNGEANAVALLVRNLGLGRAYQGRPSAEALAKALGVLAKSAGRTLQSGWADDGIRKAAERLALSDLLPSPADVELLTAVRDQQVRVDYVGSSVRTTGDPIDTDVTYHAANLTRQGWITPSSNTDRQWRQQLLTVAGRRVLEVADPSRCHMVDLTGRRCWRSGPHEDWCCNFTAPIARAVPSGS